MTLQEALEASGRDHAKAFYKENVIWVKRARPIDDYEISVRILWKSSPHLVVKGALATLEQVEEQLKQADISLSLDWKPSKYQRHRTHVS